MILFVGDKPSPKMKPGAKPFEGAACEERLYEWIFSVLPDPLCEYGIINANDAGLRKVHYYRPEDTTVALGNNASKRLTQLGIKHFKLPHPSSRNRQINDKAFIEKKLQECREWLKSHGE